MLFSRLEGDTFLLSLLLAFGNYLNGGNARTGQADGFHVELVAGRFKSGFNDVKDPFGNDVRQLVFDTYFNKYPDNAARLLRELAPLFPLVQRSYGKDADGTVHLNKSVRTEINDVLNRAQNIQREFNKAKELLKSAIDAIKDPADTFQLTMPDVFRELGDSVAGLCEASQDALNRFSELLKFFKAETYSYLDLTLNENGLPKGMVEQPMSSVEWCLIWDDLFVPCHLMEKATDNMKKAFCTPRFCKDEPLDVLRLKILWALEDFKLDGRKSKAKAKAKQGFAGTGTNLKKKKVAFPVWDEGTYY